MINDQVVENEKKLRGCHTIFYGALVCAVVISAITLVLMVGLIKQGGSGLAVYAGIMLLIFIWSAYIFLREDKILMRLISRIDIVGSEVYLETIFGRKVILNERKFDSLDLSWIKRRRLWPSYFMATSAGGVYPKYQWSDIKCIAIGSGEKPFFWICANESSILNFLSK